MRTHTHVCVCRHGLAYVARVLGSYETQLGLQRAMKDKFFALKLRFGMNLTSSGSHSKPLFFNYIKPYMVYFKGQRKSKGKTQDSLEIVNQRVSFLQNIFKSIFFWLWHFLVLIFEFWNLLINFIWLWIDLIEENGQNQAKECLFLRYKF